MNRLTTATLAALAAACAILPLSALADISPGKHNRLKCDDGLAFTYDLYIPRAYAEQPKKAFPAVFLLSPGANPGTMGLENWAQRNKVLLVSVNDSRNGQPSALQGKIQKSVLESVKKKVRLHPYLRFSIGASGAGMSSLAFAIAKDKDWAGVVVLIHSGNGLFAPRHCAVSFLAGEKDNVHGVSHVRRAYATTVKRGNPTHIKTFPELGHSSPPQKDIERELTWMLYLMMFTHPRVDAAARTAMMPDIEKRIEAVFGMANAQAQRNEIDALMAIPFITKARNYRKLTNARLKIAFDAANAHEDPVEKWIAFRKLLSGCPLSKVLSPRQKSLLKSKMAKLERRKTVSAEKMVFNRYAAIKQREARAAKRGRVSPRDAKRFVKEYRVLMKNFPDSRAAAEAKKDIGRLQSQ